MRRTHAGRGKNTVSAKLGGRHLQEYKQAGRDLFARKPKSSEPDNVGRKMRPPAHNPHETKRSKRMRSTVKRLSNRMI